MPTFTVHRLSLNQDNSTEVDLFGFSFFSAQIPSGVKSFLEQLSAAPFVNSVVAAGRILFFDQLLAAPLINSAIPAAAVGHDHSNEPNVQLNLGDLGLYGVPFPRVTRSTSDPLKTTFPFTP